MKLRAIAKVWQLFDHHVLRAGGLLRPRNNLHDTGGTLNMTES